MGRRFRTLGQIAAYVRKRERPFDSDRSAGSDNQIIYNEDGALKKDPINLILTKIISG